MPFPRLRPLIPALAVGCVVAETAPEAPMGTVTTHVCESSEVFPRTTREYRVYVPQRSDRAKPACVHITDATRNNAVYERKVTVPGYEAFTAPITPKAPGW